MISNLFDSHCHLDDPKFDPDRQEIIDSLPSKGVFRCVCIGCDIKTSGRCIELAEKNEHVYASVGIHPHEAKDAPPDYLDQLSEWLRHPKVVAIGEIGLDYHYDFSPREVQRKRLEEQLDLAYEGKVPAVFHIREAHGDILSIFKARKNRLPQGILHCYTGSAESAKEYLDMGFYVSFSGAVTFKNANKLLRAAACIPLDRLLIETDSPYLAPVPHRGHRNDPSLVLHVCQRLADLHGLSCQEMADITCANAKKAYQMIN